MNNIDYIRSQLSNPELLAGLAEEATELAHAALKLRRVIDGSNHTPVCYDEAYANLKEEIGDVLLSLEVFGISTSTEAYRHNMDEKLERWVYRLKNRIASAAVAP